MGKGTIIVLALVLGIGEAKAESLSWIDVEKRARAGNLELRAEAERVKARHAAVYAKYGEFMPSVALVGAKSEANTSLQGAVSKKHADEYGGEVRWSIFSGFSTAAGVERGKAEEAGQEALREAVSVDVRYELRIAYFQALVALENRDLFKRIVGRQRDQVALMRLKYSSGGEALWSLKKSEAELEDSEARLFSEENALRRAAERLAFLVGGGASLEASGKAEDYLGPWAHASAGLKSHPEEKRSLARIEAANAGVRIARADFFPRVSALYSYKKQKQDPVPDRVSVSQIGVSVELPIFDGLSTRRNVETAALDRSAAELERESRSRDLEANFRIALLDYEARLRRVPVAAKLHAAARDRAQVVSEQYKLGLKRFLDWEQAQVKLIDAERETIAAKRDALLALASLERAYGLKLGDG